ncbi:MULTISPECIES: YfdX family protein [Pseudomonas]|nr:MULTISPECIES: YfdX family protein [Pseudomonas]
MSKLEALTMFRKSVLATLMAATLSIPVMSVSHAQTTPVAPNAAETVPGTPDEAQKKADDARKTLIQEAMDALAETIKALDFLEKNETKEALDAMAKATGKLEIILARDSALAFAPIDVSVTAKDLLSDPETIRDIVKAARSALGDGKVQQARLLIAPLASEISIETTGLPMATYPGAIKKAASLAGKGQTAEAKLVLARALNTLVVKAEVIPIPLLNAEILLGEAQKLAEKAGRSDEENTRLAQLLQSASKEIELAEALGYGGKQDITKYMSQIKEIEKRSAGGKSGTGWFDGIRETLSKLRSGS